MGSYTPPSIGMVHANKLRKVCYRANMACIRHVASKHLLQAEDVGGRGKRFPRTFLRLGAELTFDNRCLAQRLNLGNRFQDSSVE